MSAHGATVSEQSNSRISALKDKHMKYKNLLREARKSPASTDFYIQQLKKQKLLVKDILERESVGLQESRAS